MSTKIAYYIRTSTKSISQITSIENQPDYFKNYINELKADGKFCDYDVVEAYIDWGESGTSISRRHFLHMLKDCGIETYIRYTDSKGKIIDRQIILPPRSDNNAPFPDNKHLKNNNYYFKPPNDSVIPKYREIWCKTTSRFGRSIRDLTNIMQYLKMQGVYLRFVEQELYSGKEEDEDIIASAFILDSKYSFKLSTEGKKSRYLKAKDGNLIGSAQIFGFKYIPLKRDRFEIIEKSKYIQNNDSIIVKNIFETYLETKSLTKTSKLILKDGKPFPLTSLKKIIDNPVYAGINNNLRYTQYDKSKKLYNELYNPDPDKPSYKLSEHIQAIITPELFFECQKIKKLNTIEVKNKKIGKNTEFDQYIHKLRCAYCGNNFQCDNNNGNVFYTCKTKNDNGYGIFNPEIKEYHLQKCNVLNVYRSHLLEYLNYLAAGGLYYHVQLATYNTLDDICYNIDKYFSSIDTDIEISLKNIDLKISELEAEIDKNFNKSLKAASEKLKTLLEKNIDDLDKQVGNLRDSKANLVAMVDRSYIYEELERLSNIIKTLKQHKKSIHVDDLWDYVDYISISGQYNPNGGHHKSPAIYTPMLKNFNNYKSSSSKTNYFANNVYSIERDNLAMDLIKQLEIYYKRHKKILTKNESVGN